jgi:hypothetical protein
MSHALMLVGSPKRGDSASASFAAAMAGRMEDRGLVVHTERVPRDTSGDKLAPLMAAIIDADLVVLAFPVYVDSLPAPVVALLEAWREAAEAGALGDRPRRLAVLTQCGFPEVEHCLAAIDICEVFAGTVGAEWAGALAFGVGGTIEGRDLGKSPLGGRMVDLDAAADALAAGTPIPDDVSERFARPLIPPRLYPLFGYFMWRGAARKRGCTEPLTLRRYAS